MKSPKLFLSKLTLILLLILFYCDVPEDTTESGDNINLGYAISFKASECGNYPRYPLYIAGGSAKPAKKDVNACSLSILQQPCPFRDYSYYCLKLFKNYKFKNPIGDKKK